MPILRAGFTSVFVPGGKWFVDVTLRAAQARRQSLDDIPR
jgi:hypothetical protein